MARLTRILEDAFPFAATAERSIEIDPRLATPDEIRELADQHGFRRISYGVQDFHPDTQEAIGREQTQECTFANVEAARTSGFKSINIDLIYGLPRQTAESWQQTLDTVTELRPDRIALYNFAYLPGRLAHQRTFETEQMPSPSEKLEMFMAAHDRLTAQGWEFIGMDHYALKSDSLSQAQATGTLRRNFMGYTTLRGTDMLAFGTSAISDFQGAFAQNVKKLSQYREMIEAGLPPIERGLLLNADDRLRQYIIEELMCNGVLTFDGDRGAQVAAIAAAEHERLSPLAADGLLELHNDRIVVTQKGRMFLRNIAVVFDAWVRDGDRKPMFSRAV
jgi:oxygen-independent coproporphyrinogen-3 oxidase